MTYVGRCCLERNYLTTKNLDKNKLGLIAFILSMIHWSFLQIKIPTIEINEPDE